MRRTALAIAVCLSLGIGLVIGCGIVGENQIKARIFDYSVDREILRRGEKNWTEYWTVNIEKVEVENIGNRQSIYIGRFNFWLEDADSYVYPQGFLGSGEGVNLSIGQKMKLENINFFLPEEVLKRKIKLVFQAFAGVCLYPVKGAISKPIVFDLGILYEEPANLDSVSPPEFSTIPASAEIVMRFDKPVTDVKVDGIPATGSGTVWSFKGELKTDTPFLISRVIRIEWTNANGSMGSENIMYTVIPPDITPPKVISSSPKDGSKDIDPERLGELGIKIEFNEDLRKVTVDVTIEGKALKWATELWDDKRTVNIIMLKGGELPFEAEVVLVWAAEDSAGNKAEGEITFITMSKE